MQVLIKVLSGLHCTFPARIAAEKFYSAWYCSWGKKEIKKQSTDIIF